MKKKIFSFFTTLVMLCSFVGVMPENLNPVKPLTAEAAASDFTAEQAVAWANNCAETKWNTDVDGVFGVQCVDLILGYYSYLGVNSVGGNATDYQSNALPSGWTRVKSSPQPGDIIVWADYTKINAYYTLDQYGHIGIVVAVSGNDLTTVETNADGKVSYAQKVSRNASYAACFIRPDFAVPPPPVPTGNVMSESEAAGQTLPDGDYFIFSAIDRNYYLDINGRECPAASGTNVGMYISKLDYSNPYDAWTIKYLDNGFYRIKQKGTNMFLDVSGGSLERGANVQVWGELLSNPAQEWSIARTDTGYKIQSRCNSYYLDVSGETFKSGTNVQVWEGNTSAAQRFCFVPFGPSIGQTIEDGTYTIASAIDPDYGFDVAGDENTSYKNGTNVQLWKIKDGNDTFDVKYLGHGYYSICESISGLSLSIDNKNPSEYLNINKNVQMNTYSDTNNQRWIIRDAGNGYYSIISANSGYYVDLNGGIVEPRRNIAQYTYNNRAAQKWKFEVPIPAPNYSKFTVDKTTVLVEETITFTAEADNATNYMLKIDKDGKQIDTQTMPDGQLSLTFSEAGTYSAYVTASNRSGSVDSQSITFEVKTDITLYDSEKYTLPFSSDYTFKTNNSDVAVVSKSGVVTAISVGKAIISVIDADANVIQLKVNVLPEAIVGDCNKDGEFNVADVVFLQKYLVKSQNLSSEQFLAADMNSDGKVNVFDVIILKRKLLK